MARRPRGEGPHYVDLHVGARIRSRRKSLRISLEGLSAGLGITYQQLQKYETGGNRITAPMLYAIAGALRVRVSDLYEGLPHPTDVARLEPRRRDCLERFLAAPGGPDLMAAFVDLPPHMQQPLVAMARAAVGLEETEATPDTDVGETP